MKFLADENIPLEAVNKLKNNFDVVSINEIKSGASDVEIISLSNKMKRTIITFDKGFGELIFKSRKHSHGVLLLRIPPQNPAYIYSMIKKVLSKKINFKESNQIKLT